MVVTNVHAKAKRNVKNQISLKIPHFSVAAKSLTLMGTCFYMMMGMALVSMCINLMQEQLTTKVKWVAKEVGLIKTPDIEETEDKGEDKPLSVIPEHSATARAT